MHQTRCVWLISGCLFGTKIVPPKFDDGGFVAPKSDVGGSDGGWVMAGLREDVKIISDAQIFKGMRTILLLVLLPYANWGISISQSRKTLNRFN